MEKKGRASSPGDNANRNRPLKTLLCFGNSYHLDGRWLRKRVIFYQGTHSLSFIYDSGQSGTSESNIRVSQKQRKGVIYDSGPGDSP